MAVVTEAREGMAEFDFLTTESVLQFLRPKTQKRSCVTFHQDF